MTDDDIARHNELATAQRNAAWNFLVYASQWFDRSGVREYDPDKERAHIAAKYPLKRRVKRENEWVDGPNSWTWHGERLRVQNGIVVMRHVDGDRQYSHFPTRESLVNLRGVVDTLLAQFDDADTVEDDPTWEEGT